MYKANASKGNSYTYTVILNKHVTFKPTALEHINFRLNGNSCVLQNRIEMFFVNQGQLPKTLAHIFDECLFSACTLYISFIQSERFSDKAKK